MTRTVILLSILGRCWAGEINDKDQPILIEIETRSEFGNIGGCLRRYFVFWMSLYNLQNRSLKFEDYEVGV